MSLTCHPPTWDEIVLGLSIEVRNRGDALVGGKAAIQSWEIIARNPFFASSALQSDPPIQGHSLVGFGASVMVSPAFADAEIANPRPDLNSRIIESVHSGASVLATRQQVALANARQGVDVVVLYSSCWRYNILSTAENHEAQNLMASGFTGWHAGFRMRRILAETANPTASEFLRRSVVFQTRANFPAQERSLYCMTHDSVQVVYGSLGNVLFSYREPLLRLRSADQELLFAALSGATDQELASQLGVTLSAVKARWRSTIARVGETMPSLVREAKGRDGRGTQKRHVVLAYVRNHPEELRPFDWKRRHSTTPLQIIGSNSVISAAS